MKQTGVKNIVFSSSATVYGSPEEMPITEECPKGTVYESLWMDKVYDGTDHDRCTEGKSGYECHPASLFQPSRST